MKEEYPEQKKLVFNLLRFVFVFVVIVASVFLIQYFGVFDFASIGNTKTAETKTSESSESTQTIETLPEETSSTQSQGSQSSEEDTSTEPTSADTTEQTSADTTTQTEETTTLSSSTKYPPATLPIFPSQSTTHKTEETTSTSTIPDISTGITAADITDEAMEKLITKDYLTVRKRSRPGYKLTSVENVVVHYVANPGTSAKNNRNYFNTQTNTYVSAHFIIDMNGSIIQCIPTNEIAYANGTAESNYSSISIECCHPDNTGKFTEETYISLVKLVSWLCNEFDLDEDDVLRHYDITGKSCPKYFVNNKAEWEKFKDALLIL